MVHPYCPNPGAIRCAAYTFTARNLYRLIHKTIAKVKHEWALAVVIEPFATPGINRVYTGQLETNPAAHHHSAIFAM